MKLDQGRRKILYISGWGRSGSTILSSILGQIDGFFSVGELRYIGARGLVEDRLCGCGETFSQCAVWQKVLKEAYGGVDQIDPSIFKDFNEFGCRTRHFPFLLTKAGQSYLYPHVQDGLNHLDKLYAAIQKVTDCQVMIDSSKISAYGKWLESIPSIDLYVVHIIRDPRASAYSWQRMKKQPDTDQLDFMHRMNIYKSFLSSWIQPFSLCRNFFGPDQPNIYAYVTRILLLIESLPSQKYWIWLVIRGQKCLLLLKKKWIYSQLIRYPVILTAFRLVLFPYALTMNGGFV